MLEKIIERTEPRDIFWIIIGSIAIVGFWRGIWDLMDLFIFPNNKLLSLTIPILLGLAILIFFSIYKSKHEA